MIYGVIYFLLNTINGKMYVGQTTNLKKRINEHKRGDQYVDRAIKKYGWTNFRCRVIKKCASKAEMDTWEKFFIILLNTKRPNGYNLTDGGEGTTGQIHSSETRVKMSLKHKGIPFSAEHCANISASRKGKKFSPKHCTNISATHRSNSPFKNLIAEIDKQNFSYKRLAKLLGLSDTALSRKMRGIYNFSESQITKLVEIFGKPSEYLMTHSSRLLVATSEKERRAKLSLANRHNSKFKILIAEMDNRQLSYTDLAKLMDLSRQTVSDKMIGRRNFTERDKAKLVEIFNKPIEYLLYKEEF